MTASRLEFDVTTEIDYPTRTAYIVVQETSGPGCSIRVGFDPDAVDGGYMQSVVNALPTVLDDYMRDVAGRVAP